MLYRADFHRLFDAGYVTVTHDFRLEVGTRLKKDFENGRSYYPYHGKPLHVPAPASQHPNPAFLQWHRDDTFLG